MRGPKSVDACEVLVLVDNVSDLLSSLPPGVTPEIPNVFAAGASVLGGRCLCCAQWGLSLLIAVTADGRRRTVLFDAGPEGYGVERNGQRLGVDFGAIDAAVLSHGHWDHVGGMTTALALMSTANGGVPVPLHVNRDMFVERALRRADGTLIPFESVPAPEALEAAGAALVIDGDEHLLLDECFYVSGEIPRVTAFERGFPGHVRQGADGRWEDDPLIVDERFVAVHVRDKGIVVFTACSHAGLINVLTCARARFAPVPLYGVMGGFHLSGGYCETIIGETVEALREFGLHTIVAGHCTGWRALHRLVAAFGDTCVVPSAVGRRHCF
jgi:7,8-dihydropterin-6-yl-methyl-4-(beta-D-ribofuranosyl)aminobenzene 5'-phosphate synthase